MFKMTGKICRAIEERTENMKARLHGPSQAQTEELSVDDSRLHTCLKGDLCRVPPEEKCLRRVSQKK